ncbi:MAG: hypothetical protein WCC97_14435 [Candidatus Acidiferrales bacterium]
MSKPERWRQQKYIKLHRPKSGHKHYVLEYQRKRKSGKYGKSETWPLKGKVPDWIFKRLVTRCQDLLKEIPSRDKNYRAEFPVIADVLVRFGITLGFKAHRRRDYGDVTWYLHGRPVATFMIANLSHFKQLWGSVKVIEELWKDKSGEAQRFDRMLRKCKAPMRVVWAVSCNGKWFRLGVGKMRTRKGHKHGRK